MKLHLLATLALPVVFLVSDVLRAEVDRSRKDEEEKKARPELEVEDSGKDSHQLFHEKLATEGEKNLEEIQRLLDEVNQGLSKRNTGSGTQAKQRQAVERMKKLIGELSKGCQQCQKQGGSSGSSGKQPQKQGQGKQSEKEKRQQADARKNQDQLPSEKQRQTKPQGQKEDNRERLPNNQVAEDQLPESGKARLIERLRQRARWGFLPPKLSEELLSAKGKDAPQEYQDIVDRYYKRISEYYDRQKRSPRK